MGFDCDVREADVTALDTATSLTALGAATPGNFIVPATAHRITQITINAVPDITADTIFAWGSAIKIRGAGIASGGELVFPGPFGANTGGTNVDNQGGSRPPQQYHVDIPVNPGGQFGVDGYMLGTLDVGSLRIVCEIEYDGVPGLIKDMDYRYGELTAANTFVRLTERDGGVTFNSFKAPTGRIAELHYVSSNLGVAGPLATVIHYQMYGAALMAGGNYSYMGHAHNTATDIATFTEVEHNTSIRKLTPGFLIRKNNVFDVQAEMIEDDVGTVSCAFAVGYC